MQVNLPHHPALLLAPRNVNPPLSIDIINDLALLVVVSRFESGVSLSELLCVHRIVVVVRGEGVRDNGNPPHSERRGSSSISTISI